MYLNMNLSNERYFLNKIFINSGSYYSRQF